jgi:recombinase, phage RecT family
MAVNNSLTQQKPKFSVAISSESYRKLINNTLGNPKRSERFVASISSAVATNPALQECDAGSILSAALLGEALGLSPSPQLGQYYLVPFNDKKRGGKVAQFQLGYKGYIQLAIRSGQYKKLNVLAIKDGELVNYSPLDEDIEVRLIEDDIERENAQTIGYYAMFEYTNGFRKAMYWSYEKMQAHADRFSQAYSAEAHARLIAGEIPQGDMWKFSSFWCKDFDGMAIKTMLRQLISKWGIMSIEMQNAVENDMAVIKDDGSKEYVEGVEYDSASPEPQQSLQEHPEESDPLS